MTIHTACTCVVRGVCVRTWCVYVRGAWCVCTYVVRVRAWCVYVRGACTYVVRVRTWCVYVRGACTYVVRVCGVIPSKRDNLQKI